MCFSQQAVASWEQDGSCFIPVSLAVAEMNHSFFTEGLWLLTSSVFWMHTGNIFNKIIESQYVSGSVLGTEDKMPVTN
jgi:hypothetical protein